MDPASIPAVRLWWYIVRGWLRRVHGVAGCRPRQYHGYLMVVSLSGFHFSLRVCVGHLVCAPLCAAGSRFSRQALRIRRLGMTGPGPSWAMIETMLQQFRVVQSCPIGARAVGASGPPSVVPSLWISGCTSFPSWRTRVRSDSALNGAEFTLRSLHSGNVGQNQKSPPSSWETAKITFQIIFFATSANSSARQFAARVVRCRQLAETL